MFVALSVPRLTVTAPCADGTPSLMAGSGPDVQSAPYIGVDANPKIAPSRRFEFPLRNVSLGQGEHGRQAANDRDRQREPACQIASVVLPAHDRHPRVLRQNGEKRRPPRPTR